MTNEFVIYTITGRHIITNNIVQVMGTFSNRELADEACAFLQKNAHNNVIKYKVQSTYIDDTRTIANFQSKSKGPPKYIIEALEKHTEEVELKTLVNNTTMKIVNNILTEILNCADNPEVVKEYIQGLQDGVEDLVYET